MPITYNNLAHLIYSYENLEAAFKEVSRSKNYQQAILEYKYNLEENLINLQNHLIWKTYRPRPYHCFIVYEPKERPISAPHIEDRIVHHALCRVVGPLFEKKMIYSSYASRVGKGSLAACKRVQRYIRQQPYGSNVYYAHLDFRKYFPSMPHATLRERVRRTIRDKWVLWLFDVIIDSFEPGMPIGSLTSQMLANVVADRLDHYICDELGVKYYARYMDDIIIVSTDAARLQSIIDAAQYFVTNILRHALNQRKTHVAVAEFYYDNGKVFDAGIDFAGYRIHRHYLELRKRNVKQAKKRHRKIASRIAEGTATIKNFEESFNSFIGYAKHAQWDRFTYSAITDAVSVRQEVEGVHA